MINFLLLYWFTTALLFALFYWDVSPLAVIINDFQTNLTIYLTHITLPIGSMDHNEIIINRHYHLVIEKACNGMVPFLFFLASIVAFPSTIQHKIVWGFIGYTLITTMNTLRIWLITQLVLEEAGNFSLAHDYMGNILLIATGILLFIRFIKTRSRYNYTQKG